MKTILLLGGYGFLGTNIIKHIDTLLNDKYQVIVLDKNLSHPYGVTFHSVIKTYAGDYSDPNLLKEIFSQDKIDLVLSHRPTKCSVRYRDEPFPYLEHS